MAVRDTSSGHSQSSAQCGFSETELLAGMVIFGALAATALLKFSGTESKAAGTALEPLRNAVIAGRDAGYAWCQQTQGCVGGSTQFRDAAGRPVRFVYGYPDAGVDATADIGAWVTAQGVTVVNVSVVGTRFQVDRASDPTQCYVQYLSPLFTAFSGPPIITSVDTGC